MDLRRGFVWLLLCLSLIATGWAAGPAMAEADSMQADCPAMQDAMPDADQDAKQDAKQDATRADDASSAPMPSTHRDHGCCPDGACHCAGAHGVAVTGRASQPIAMRIVGAAILLAVPDRYVSPTLLPPVRPPIA